MRSARRFFILDNALTTMVGHFYEYDVSVLAALPPEFEGTILGNVDAPAELCGTMTPYFHCDFWAPSKGRRAGAGKGSRGGAAPGPVPSEPPPPPELGDSRAGDAVRPTLLDRLKAVGRRLERADRWWSRAALRLGRPLYFAYRARCWRADANDCVGSPEDPSPEPGAPVLTASDTVLRDVFLQDLLDLVDEYGVGPDDVLFFPNMNLWAFAAVIQLVASRPHCCPRMKLLFRRNIFTGRPTVEQYHSGDYGLRSMRQLFSWLESLGVSSVGFFTDTERLKDEYEVVSPFPFTVLPIPFRHDYISPKSSPGRPLTVTYLGNARWEKGFQHIPAMVKHLRARVERGEVEFVLQAVPDPDPAILDALADLKRLNLATLLEKPLSDRAYYDLISRADVLLLVYDPVQYYSRSSCIFVESLVSGTPFLTVAGSWMADVMPEGTGEAVAGPADMPEALERIVVNYPAYFEASRRASQEWRQRHNARSLVEALLGS